METVKILAQINNDKKSEFFQTFESLTSLVSKFCEELDVEVSPYDDLEITILFSDKDSLANNFYNEEFNILKGTVRSLCNNVRIEIKNAILN